MRKQLAGLLIASFCCLLSKAQTLGEVLREHHVQVIDLGPSELEQQITSFAVSTGESPFLIAYYEGVAGDLLPPTIHVLRYEPGSRELLKVALQGEDLAFAGFGGVSKKIPKDCMGSALSVSESGGVVAIDTHVNPSAGCILILDSSLSFKAAVWGWTIARLERAVLYQGAMIHFAPVHAGTLYIYDVQGRVTPLYPPASDRVRTQFSARLRKYLPSRQYCAEQNLECDPTHFNTDFLNLHVNTLEDRIDVDVQMTSEGFGPAAQQHVQTETVHYVYAKEAHRWRRISP